MKLFNFTCRRLSRRFLDTPDRSEIELEAIFSGGPFWPGEKEGRMKKILRILVFVLVCDLAGTIGRFFTAPSIPA
jgi:hypothetical protein